MIKKSDCSILIISKDEKDNLVELDFINKCKKYSDDVIFVDGRSKDGSLEYAQTLADRVLTDNGKGKGAAIRYAVPYAKNNIVIFIDADGSHDPDDIPRIVQPIVDDEYDHVGGSRTTEGSDEYFGSLEKFMRVTGSHIILLLINYRFKVHLSDSQNGFRAIKKSVFNNLDLKENKTTIEQEMIIKSLRKGYRVGEVPAHEYSRLYGHSKISLIRDSFKYVYSAIKYSFF
mgnify:CR=1 FL=1